MAGTPPFSRREQRDSGYGQAAVLFDGCRTALWADEVFGARRNCQDVTAALPIDTVGDSGDFVSAKRQQSESARARRAMPQAPLAAALPALAPESIRAATKRMASVSRIRLTRQLFSRVQLDSNRRAYRFLINVCRLLFDTRLVDEESGESRFAGVDLERMTLWRVFENFTARFYEIEQAHYRVRAQTQLEWWALKTFGRASEGRIPVMKPDLLLESAERRIILDTKFYESGGLSDETDAKLHSGDLYQLFAYVMNRERTKGEGPRHEGILLYPTVGEETRVEFKTHDYRFQARSIDLTKSATEIHRGMLEAVDLADHL